MYSGHESFIVYIRNETAVGIKSFEACSQQAARMEAGAEQVAAHGLYCSKLAGALIVPPRQVATLKSALAQCQWCRPGRSICPWEGAPPPSLAAAAAAGGLMAVHVVPEAAAVLNDPSRAAEVPAAIAPALTSGELVWQPGVRLGSSACGGPLGKQCDSAVYALREAVFSRPIWRPPIPDQRFRFAELFAGIGGFRLGLEAVGGRCVFASERDVHACTTYHANFGDVPFGDITEVPVSGAFRTFQTSFKPYLGLNFGLCLADRHREHTISRSSDRWVSMPVLCKYSSSPPQHDFQGC